MVKKNPDFRFNRRRKSGKTEFFEVHTERALITQLIQRCSSHSALFSATCVHGTAEYFHDKGVMVQFYQTALSTHPNIACP